VVIWWPKGQAKKKKRKYKKKKTYAPVDEVAAQGVLG